MKKIHWILIGICAAASFVAEFGFLAGHPKEHWWSYVPGFYAIWGFIGCVAIIVISKAAGKLFIQKKEDYYDAR
jgi:uncharacterized membrane protein